MQTRFIFRLLGLSLVLAFVFAGANRYSAFGKAERIDWTDTKSQENVLVQACDGFDITTNYTADLSYHLITDNTGDEVSEQLNVDFAGSIGNAVTGKSYQYDGHFTRWSNYIRNGVTITDLELRFEVGTPGQFSVTIDRIKMDLLPDPAEVVKKLVPNALQMDLCYVLADTLPEINSGYEFMPSAQELVPDPANEIHTENSALPGQSADEMTPWTELDPCDSTPAGKPC